MGSSSSKVASKAGAVGVGRRQYPSTSSILNSATSSAKATPEAPSLHSNTTPSEASHAYTNPESAPPSASRSAHIELDARDPDFGAALRKLGPAVPVDQSKTTAQRHGRSVFPSSDPSRNPALLVIKAREQTARIWQEESENLGRSSFIGRTLVNAKDIGEILRLRDEEGLKSEEIEKQMRLRSGLVKQLGARGVVENV